MSRRDSPLRADRGGRLVEIAGEQLEIAWDPDGEVWYVRASSVRGLMAQGRDREALMEELEHLVRLSRMP